MLTAADAAVEIDHVRILNRRAPAAQRPQRKPIFEDPKCREQDKTGQPDAGKKLQEAVQGKPGRVQGKHKRGGRYA